MAALLGAGYALHGRRPTAVIIMGLVGIAIAMIVAVVDFVAPTVGPPLGNLVANAELGQRAAGPFGNPNYMGTLAAAGIVIALAVGTSSRSAIAKSLLALLAILCLVALVQSQSRGAMIAGFAGLAAVSWTRSRGLTVAIIAAGVIAAVLIYPAFVQWRLDNIQGDATDSEIVAMGESDSARLGGALAGPAMFLAEPVFGVGFGHFVTKSVEIAGLETGINAHNWYVNVLGEQGAIGTVLWLGATAAALREIWARRTAGRTIGFGMLATLTVGFLFLEEPESFQTIAVPLVVLVAAFVADWGPADLAGPARSDDRVPRRGLAGDRRNAQIGIAG
jgi:O-antigen ligase